MRPTVCRIGVFGLMIVGLLIARAGQGQEIELIKSMFDLDDPEPAENSDWLEQLWDLTENPLDLNKAGLAELMVIPFIDAQMAQQIIRHREKNQRFHTLEELRALAGFNEEILEAISPLITVKSPRLPSQYRYRLRAKYETPSRIGYQKGIYHSPLYLHQRFIFQTPYNLSGGLLWEKDSGEENYFDYGSFHLQYQHPAKKYSMVVGDYYQKIGTGLILWSPYGIPLSTNRLPILSDSSSPTQLNKSSAEFGFLRGVSLNVNIFQHILLTVFYSNVRLDASLSADANSVKTFYTSGLHRTETEKNKRSVVKESLGGFIIKSTIKNVFVQLAAVKCRYFPSLNILDYTPLYFSFSYKFNIQKLVSAGEFSVASGKYPALQNYLFFTNPRVKLSIVGYYYHPLFYSLHGRALGTFSGETRNLSGFAITLTHRVNSVFRVGGYLHVYQENQNFTDNPYVHQDYLFEFTFQLPTQQARIRFSHKCRPNENSLFPNENKLTDALQLDYRFKVTKSFVLKSQLNLRWVKPVISPDKYQGVSLSHGADWRFDNFKIIAGWTAFDVPVYDLRIYEIESDLPGSFRSVLLNGRGYKFFILVSWQGVRSLQVDLKYGLRYYPDEFQIGSGSDAFPANRIRDYRLSVVWRM